jgi:hypothetical protein
LATTEAQLAPFCAGIALCALALVLRGTFAAAEPPAPVPAAPAGAPPPVVRYRLRARLDPAAHRVDGGGEVVWRNDSRVPQRELWLHLYLNAFAGPETVFMRKGETGFRGSERPETWGGIDVTRVYARELGVDLWQGAEHHTPGDPEDATDVRLALPEAVPPGGTLTLELAWVSRLPSVTLRTGFAGSFHMVAQWYPKLARLERDGTWAHFPFHRLSEFYADFGDYEVAIDVPSGFTVGATGVEIARVEESGRAVITHAQRGVHDFAFTAWDGFAEAHDAAGGVALRCLYPAGEDNVAAIELAEVKAALPQLEAAYGKYPYPTLTIVHPPEEAGEAGGMEYPTLITTGGNRFTPYLGARALEVVTTHELAHQWFYGMVASNEYRHAFLDEGLTTFATARAMEERFPGASGFDGFGWTLSLHAVARGGAARSWDRGPVSRRADKFKKGSEYGDLVYNRTAALLETLSRVYGSARVDAALRAYAREQRFAHPRPVDLLGAIERHVGADAAASARLVLMKGAGVDYAVEELDGSRVRLRRTGELVFPVDVELWLANGERRRQRWDGSEELTIDAGAELDAVVIDPDLAVLLDHHLANNARRRRPQPIAPRILAQGAFLGHFAAMLVAP